VSIQFDLDRAFLFALLLARAGGLVVAAPLWGDRAVPRKVRVFFAGALALLMLALEPAAPARPESVPGLALLAGAELSVGLAMGFVARLVVLAFEMAGRIVAIQMGLGAAVLFDPGQARPSNVLGRWMWIVGMTFFLGLGGHHHLLRAVAGSLDTLPLGRGLLGDGVIHAIVGITGESLVSALQIAAPAIGVLLLTSLGLGLLARTVPTMNVFMVGLPLKIAAGLITIALTLPYALAVARSEVGNLVDRLATLVVAA
jgi:flagellar biosynthetic protein FliR